MPDRKLVVVPVLNPDGLSKNRRQNANRVDLNRNFPAENFQASTRFGPRPLSEPEAALVADLVLDLRPTHVVSFHQPASCIDYDGPAEELARSMAAVSPLPVQRLGGRPGSLGSWVGEALRIPTITVELPRGVERLGRDELWARHGPLVERAVHW